MTTPDQINTMAEHAALAAADCFGKLDPPGAPTAYIFIYQVAYDDENGPLPAQLTSREFRKFRHDYCRWLRNAGVDLDTAQTAAFGRS